MWNALAPGTWLGYCTNVHAGVDYAQTLANLQEYALPVKRQVSPDAPMGVGLWLSQQAARRLLEEQRLPDLAAWLEDHDLHAHTINGFPFGDFHSQSVKYRVYHPTWATQQRFDYTCDLIDILVSLLPEDAEGSISTLPIGWGPDLAGKTDELSMARQRLMDIVHHLARVELDTGKLIHVDLEPEPGCVMSTSEDARNFFSRLLENNPDALSARSYLRICHDVCHAAVMFEDQADVIDGYLDMGLSIGKVQVSSAVEADLAGMDEKTRETALADLEAFAEQRYLHQTVIRRDDGTTVFYDDLPEALQSARAGRNLDACWRVHFHVPVFLGQIGLLSTTQDDIRRCIAHLLARQDDTEMPTRIFEVETYAWDVLPAALHTGDLSHGIAREMDWTRQIAGGESHA